MKPIMMLDIDGVCIKWQSALPYFCGKHNLPVENAIKCNMGEVYMGPAEIFQTSENIAQRLMVEYNNSKFIRYLQPYMDALEFINHFKDDFDFIAVTALSDSNAAIMNRMFNLNSLFPGAFIDVMSCNFGESKAALFRHAIGTYGDRLKLFIDDLPSNLDCLAEVNRELFHLSQETIKRFHMLRGPRDTPKYDATAINSFDDGYLSKFCRDLLKENKL